MRIACMSVRLSRVLADTALSASLFFALGSGVAEAQHWVPPPVAVMPGTHIPYPSTYIPAPVQSNIYGMPGMAPGMQLVPDPANPRRYLGAGPPESYGPGQRQYASRFISLDETRMINPWNGEVMRSSIQPNEGIYQRPLELRDFYQRIGGKELEDSYVSRRKTRSGLIGAGIVGLSVGGALSIVGGTLFLMAALDSPDPKTGRCTISPVGCRYGNKVGYGTMMGVGLALMIGGGISLPIGVAYKADPIPASEARQLTDEYNQSLRRQLGLSPRAPAAQPPSPPPPPADTEEGQ